MGAPRNTASARVAIRGFAPNRAQHIIRLIDIQPDPRQLHNSRLNPKRARRRQMRHEAIVAKLQRHHQGRRAQHGIGPTSVMRGNDGERWRGATRLNDRGDLRCRNARDVARQRQHIVALHRKNARHRGNRTRVAVARIVGDHPRPIAAGKFGRDRIKRVDHDARDRRVSERRQHVLQHRRRQRLTLLRRQQRRQTLFGSGEFLHRHRRPHARCHRSRRSTRAAPRTVRASASRSASVFIIVCPR